MNTTSAISPSAISIVTNKNKWFDAVDIGNFDLNFWLQQHRQHPQYVRMNDVGLYFTLHYGLYFLE